ncbi:uncharacterized protein CcaverHIS019_0103340 [Cutaneotrichosporon cavernicola]|uniref:HlyIII-domain-containing protein n=1 Tax=Cutaneotrichosporon cavernicola TaxID=279322 RepID=A0AA48IB71_9TREE|nr:uncharacterized protein CcaverHIS019_0103340 [Cutaneotrichosporon cavernicola]BEI87616.1 hypothetical protein CcaverHIS019_0103340 [Cutaneotrichosporon cavernicola]BEJ03161.1 hypothetical protein CcaverHIS641_0103360 [Cutaneotrichosporon cavernicola]
MTSPSSPSPSPTRRSWRQLSHPNLTTLTDHSDTVEIPSASFIPTLSLPHVSVSGLRAALLGYLGEAEIALRERLGTATENRNSTSSPSPSSEDETDYDTLDEHDLLVDAESSARQALDEQAPGLRRRGAAGLRPLSPSARLAGTGSEAEALLDTLRSLREDVAAYVPAGFSMPKLPLEAQRQWLRELPHRLQDVNLSVHGDSWPDPVSASNRAMRSAQHRVIDLVHALLPPDDWQGWESLGWEDDEGSVCTPRRVDHTRSCSLDERYARPTEGSDEDEDEPEYLFPNRTPAPAHAFKRHRHPRSKSLSQADYYDRGPLFNWHFRPDGAAVVDDEGDDGSVVDEDLLAEHEQHDELRECDKHGAHLIPDLGTTIEEALVRSEQGLKLITYQDLPIWWRNNQYLLTGYRFIPLGRNGPIPLIKSAFRMHNETVNIHSHFIPTLFILGVIPFIIWRTPLPDAHWIDTAMLISYLLAAMSCLVSSAGWHILSGCANRRWFEWGACVDYIGISWLIAMSFNTVVYNAYYCRGTHVFAYTLVNVAFGGLGSYLPFQKWFNQRKNKPWRILFFLCLNAAMFAPMVQLFREHGRHVAGKFVAPFFYSVAMYLVGLTFYAFHFPECAAPGIFDRFGASHQLWHLSIVTAIVLHYRAIFVAYDARWSLSCAAPDAGNPVPLAISAFLFGK